MTICFFGYPNQNYSRSKILINGLKKNNCQIVHCTDKSGLAPIRYWILFKKFIALKKNPDIIFVQFPGHLNMPIAWVLGKIYKIPVVFDAFISLFDTYVFDRRSVEKGSIKAHFYWWVDKISCLLADVVTIDTKAHIRYFCKTFKLSSDKFKAIPVGADSNLFKKLKTKNEKSKLVIEFHGMFTRLHGAEIFVKAAKKLENHPSLQFWLIGSSHNYKLPINLYKKLRPRSLTYFRRLTVTKLAPKIAQADISIAHLGPTQKARMVVTNKMYQALAVSNALIAGNNTATKEVFKDKKTALFTTMNNVDDLVKKILYLKKYPILRRKIAQNGHRLYQQKYTNKVIGKKLKGVFSSIF